MSIALFDLDGTIVDSGPTIVTSATETLEAFGFPVPGMEQLRRFVGPPINIGIVDVLGVPEGLMVDFRTAYRARYTQRMLEAPMYDGMEALLRDLAESGWIIGLATSKREDMALALLDHHRLAPLFRVTAGADVAELRADKASVVERALRLFSDQGVDASEALMVGDRAHDILGARAHGLRGVYVTWGYGSDQDIDESRPFAVAENLTQLRQILGS